MFRTFLLSLALFPAAAFAGDAEITLKFDTDVAGALDLADPSSGWTPVPTTMGAKTKADILIESMGGAIGEPLVVTVNPDLTAGDPWGRSTDGQFSIYAVDSVEFGPGARSGLLDALPMDGAATIEAPRDLTWEQAAAEHVGYVIVDNLTSKAVTTIPIIFH